MILLVLASVAVLVAAIAFAATMPRRGTLAALVAIGLLVWAIVVTTIGFAGLVLRSLDGTVLLVLAVGWAVAAIALAARRDALTTVPARVSGAVASFGPVVRWPPVLIALGLIVLTLVWRTFLALRLPVVDYDGWSYHLVFVDVWLQHDALVPVLQRPWTAGYPADGELLTTWLAAFTRSDQLAGFASLLAMPLAIVATMGLARGFDASPRTSALAGLVFGMTPALVGLTGTSYVDVASVAAVVAAWWLGLRIVGGERHTSTVLLLGIAVGLAIGTKGTNLFLVGAIGVVAGIQLLLAASRRHPDLGVAVVRLAVLVLPVVVLGGSWFLKNLVAFGNPMYPFELGPLHGVTTLAEFQLHPPELEGRSMLGSLLASWTWDWQIVRYPYNVRPGGLGRAWPLIALVAVVGAGILVRNRRVAAVALVLIPAGLTLLVLPMAWYARLTLFLPAVGLALVAVVLDALRPRIRLVAGLALVGVAAISLAFVNLRPNLDLRPQESRLSSTRAYLRLLAADAATREAISLRGTCSGFDQIPAGARVAPGGFNLLHAAVGHDMSRWLTEAVTDAGTPEELVAAMRAQDATWLAASADGRISGLAAQAPELVDRGESCQGSHLWELVPGG